MRKENIFLDSGQGFIQVEPNILVNDLLVLDISRLIEQNESVLGTVPLLVSRSMVKIKGIFGL